MLTYQQALDLVRDMMIDDHIILEEHGIEKDYGWVFFYQSKRFVETGDMNFALVGNCPILVEKETGRVVELPTHTSVEEGLRKYEKERRKRS